MFAKFAMAAGGVEHVFGDCRLGDLKPKLK
jgi:hypothetical protein